MLHIILLILKIIGIILLCIIGIVLAAILCVLFVPVRYRIRITREEGEDKPPAVAYVKVTWLLHIVNILVRYPAQVIVRARVFLFTLFRMPKKEKKHQKTPKAEKHSDKSGYKKHDDAHDEPDVDTERQEPNIPAISEENTVTSIPEPREEYIAFDTGTDDLGEKEPDVNNDEKKSLFGKIGNIYAKIKQVIEKIKGFFQNIQYTIRKICDKIKAVLNNIQYYREVLESDSFLRSADLCKSELAWVFKKLKPRKCEADFVVGMKDPAATGEILAIYGILYPLVGQHVRIIGDFECDKMHVEGRLYISGKIRVFTFLRTAIRIYFNKDIKKLIRLLKKEAA